MNPKCKVSVRFYSHTHQMYRNETLINKFWTWLIVFWSKSTFTHCSVRITSENGTDAIIYMLLNRPAALMKADVLIRWSGEADVIVDVGKLDINWKHIESVVNGNYKVNAFPVLAWFFCTRFFHKWKPKTCATSACEVLRAGGLDIPIIVAPGKLLKELTNEFNYDSRKG
tara:strand:+ start:1256 stop:1765 length:510 start_codon:yes stop_codon:yes gene_type:complete